ncbi:MAG: RNA polymerase sigma factor [Oscillospiraceae bacterium]|jgi:RNA polymerase sigma factor (sigma-70 family)|nr:RNA polymerase sigma factor [Oscillospiraceae bacterium]
MDKSRADALIAGYTKKLFGFALSKTGRIDDAEELAARATLEVYASLLRSDEIANVDGYVYRVASNVYARYVAEQRGGAHVSLDDYAGAVPSSPDAVDALVRDETAKLLRREIAYLTKTQREIVIAHYYDRLKQSEIARRLGLPVGTVKWHLHEAKSSLKEGLNMRRELGTLGVKPIRLTELGHSGHPGDKGDTADFLARRLTQNIAYAAYWQPRTVREIAEELGVSPLFVEDEVAVLEEYGFMERLSGDRYRTQIYITGHLNAEQLEREHAIYVKYAKIVCEKYIPTAIEYLRDRDKSYMYIPDGDFNLLLWSALPYAVCKLSPTMPPTDDTRFNIKRPDGGDYIAYASLETDSAEQVQLSYDPNLYEYCGPMIRGSDKYPVRSWQRDTYYDGRGLDWRNNLFTDYEYLYEFMTGNLGKTDANIDKFKRLYDKRYLDANDTVNLVVINDGGTSYPWDTAFLRELPGLTDELRAICGEFDAETYALEKDGYPAHMRELCRAWHSGGLAGNTMISHTLAQLVRSGVLTPQSETRRAGLGTLVFSDTLPR